MAREVGGSSLSLFFESRKGNVRLATLDSRLSAVGVTARFSPGDPVRVRPGAKPGHVRTPDYLKGKEGRVEAVLGAFPNPEDLAYGLSGEPERVLYKVGFVQGELWPDYEGPAEESLYADVFEHWLEER